MRRSKHVDELSEAFEGFKRVGQTYEMMLVSYPCGYLDTEGQLLIWLGKAQSSPRY